MAKLIVLALAFTALVAFATAHTTTFTTTTTIENPFSKQQCRRQIQGEQFDECQMYLQQDESSMRHQQEQQQGIRMCCKELQRIDDECVCDAVTQIFGEAQQQQQRQQSGRQGQQIGAQQIQRLKQKAQNIPNICKIQTERCQIRTNTAEERFSQGCRQIVQSQPFNQCKSFIAQQIRSPRTMLMSVTKQGQEQECCDEIQNVNEECQCEAMKEVYNKVIQQQESEGRQYGGQKQQMRQQVRQVIQMLPNQCGLDVEQCRIPSEMFQAIGQYVIEQ